VKNTDSDDSKPLQSRIVSGTVMLLAGTGLTTTINFAYNLLVAWFLGPAGFGHATVVYTLLTILSAVALAFQIVSAKLVAQQGLAEQKAQAYRILHRASWMCGLLAALSLLLFRKPIANYLNLPDPMLVALLAIGCAFYVPLGSRRGCVQGIYRFRTMAGNLVLEGAIRLAGSCLLIILNFGVRGVIAANAAAIVIAYFTIAPKLAGRAPTPFRFEAALRETGQAMCFFSGQMLLTNADIVIVKHLFSPEQAGLYAAVALAGRVISSCSSAVMNSTFPIVAGTGEKDRNDLRVIATSLMLVLGIGFAITVTLGIMPARWWMFLLGSGFKISGIDSISYLSAFYALKTVVYSASVVFITYEMACKIANTSLVQLLFGGVVIAGIFWHHSSLSDVVAVQFYLMLVLLMFVTIPFFADFVAKSRKKAFAYECSPVTLLRRVPEEEVVAAFLKSDARFAGACNHNNGEQQFAYRPNLDNGKENVRRSGLRTSRHIALWSEVPEDTAWYEAIVNQDALEHIRVFPRAYWRKLARGNFSITSITMGLRNGLNLLDAGFAAKIRSISRQLTEEEVGAGTVLLLGVNESMPVTVFDGNHRMVAALLSMPYGLSRLRFLCGLSPRMTECCWYRTSLSTLCRYARHVMARAMRNPMAEIKRFANDVRNAPRLESIKVGTIAGLAETNDVQP